MELKLKEIVEQDKETKKEILSVFSEIITDTEKEPVNYVKNWKAPGGGE